MGEEVGNRATPSSVPDLIRLEVLTEAVDRVASDTDGRRWMGKRALERYDEEFSAEEWAVRLRSLYDEILGEER